MKKLFIPFTIIAALVFWGCFGDADYAGGPGSYGGYYENDYYPGTEQSLYLEPNSFILTDEDAQSTFGMDVDAASYTFHRSKVQNGYLPNKEAVRVEEFINYFDYAYPTPSSKTFSVTTATAQSPFKDSVVNLVVGIKGKVVDSQVRKPWNLTFLIDISGSMSSRLDLVKSSLGYLVDGMRTGDKLSICTYAGSVGTVLTPTTLTQCDKSSLKGIINDLRAGGGTAMADGMINAYSINQSGLINDGVNRVVVCSDGDANIGYTSFTEILASVQEYADNGIMMTTLGYGSGNYNDAMMEQLANKGNGNYYYIDSEAEAENLFSTELLSVMSVIATDARIQLTFDAGTVTSYRLLGYENRDIADSLFEVDTTDAGEVGEGHTVTAVYELILNNSSGTVGSIALRYIDENGVTQQQDVSISLASNSYASMSEEYKLAVTVAEYAEILRESRHTGTSLSTLLDVIGANSVGNTDKRTELHGLIQSASQM